MSDCTLCWAAPRGKNSYLVYLSDNETGQWGRCVVQSECSHGMQEWAEDLARQGMLYVHDSNDERFLMLHPQVIHVDPNAAAHIPIVNPVN